MKESELDHQEVIAQAEAILKENAESSILDKDFVSRWLPKINGFLSIFNREIRLVESRYKPYGLQRIYRFGRPDNSNRSKDEK